MNKLIYLLATIFFITSCKKESNQKKINIPNQKTEAPFHVNFSKVDAKKKKELKSKISKFYSEKINVDHFSGGFLVAKNGEIIFEDYEGFTNYKDKKKIDKNAPLHLASISKVLTASVILRMIDEGKLQLEDTFQKYFPEFPFEKITIQMLLNHRSGIPNYAYFTDKKEIWNKSEMLYNTDVLKIICNGKIDLEFRPDSKFSYCNTNYALLALLIEKISDMPFPEAMQKLLFEPLDMKSTYVFDYKKDKDTASLSYKSTWEKIPYDHLDAVYGDKNIYSTPRDLLKFDLATYSNKFFSDSLRAKIFKGYSYESKGVKNYGLGIRLREWENDVTMFYHNGWWHGSTTSYLTLKKDTVAIIGLSNKFTRKVYQTKQLSVLFGNYPFELDED